MDVGSRVKLAVLLQSRSAVWSFAPLVENLVEVVLRFCKVQGSKKQFREF